MHTALRLLTTLIVLTLPLAARAEQVAATDDDGHTSSSTHECPGHQILTRNMALENVVQKYAFKYSGCVQGDAHGGEHPSAEGNFGMPSPSVCNWYHSGFLTIDLNGKDVVRQDLKQVQVTESGERGGFQVIWSHPDAEVSLRIVLLPGQNHVNCLLKWQPREGKTIKNVKIGLRCYPSFFTTAMRRNGERHCKTPRTDQKESSNLALVPGQDTWLYYYDTVFDLAKGEGSGPCAAVIQQAELASGRVQIDSYPENTSLNVKPEAGQYRLALYDFTGKTNADAEAYLQAHAVEDLAQLLALDFRPGPVRSLDPARLRAEATQLIADAGDDGVSLKPKVEDLLRRVDDLSAKAHGGDWQAEAELSARIQASQDLFWRLKTFALLNRK